MLALENPTTHLQTFSDGSPRRPKIWADLIVLSFLAALLYFGARLAYFAPTTITGSKIALSPLALPWYAALSTARMTAAYILSLVFSLSYGYLAAKNARTAKVFIPLLDIFQSVPILSFLPVVLLSFTAIMPEKLAIEIASIVLIFTSQVWNLTYCWYQSLNTIPSELKEASRIFRFRRWQRFCNLELPFASISLVWNSMMSWSGGWFFLMAAEIFSVGKRDFRLPGLGAYLHEAASQGNTRAIFWGIAVLILVVVLLDQLIWRPLLAWVDPFKLEMVCGDDRRESWFYNVLRSTRVFPWLNAHWIRPGADRIERFFQTRRSKPVPSASKEKLGNWVWIVGAVAAGGLLLYGAALSVGMIAKVTLRQWESIGLGISATFLRILLALILTLAWAVPCGYAIGSNRKLAAWLQPLVQIAAAVPATALFPVLVLFLAQLPAGLNLAAIFLMLLGTQWYMLFNVIGGAASIPQDLRYTASLLQLSRWQTWKTLILPALFPHIITGAITATGGAWNASIIAEYVEFGGKTLQVRGIGSVIATATASGDYNLLLASTLTMIVTVVTISRLGWRPLYQLAQDRFKLE